MFATVHNCVATDPVDECFARCVGKYGGSILRDHEPAYYCAKGCAGIEDTTIKNRQLYTEMAPSERRAACTTNCSASSDSSNYRDMCRYGCRFWPAGGGTSVERPGPTRGLSAQSKRAGRAPAFSSLSGLHGHHACGQQHAADAFSDVICKCSQGS